MTTTATSTLSEQQIADYQENGYLVVRNVLSADEVDEFRRVVQHHAQVNAYPPSLKYPEPAKYTISGNKLAEPGLAPIAEIPAVIDAVEGLFGQPAHLAAFVAYVRTPGNKGGPAHCDYKRWRPVGSSMNWMFAIIPLTDFDEVYGQFLVSPGSHKLTQMIDENVHIQDLTGPDPKQLPPFIDPDLKAGDLLLANQHTWHLAPTGTAQDDRCGIFHKFCAANAPPAAGHYPYNSAALNALSDAGKRLIPVCFDKPIATTRLLIERPDGDGSRYLLLRDEEQGGWGLPGGEGWEEEGTGGWDVGARIASLQALTKEQLGLDIPWMSYIEDVEMEDGICRVYGFSDESLASRSLSNGLCDWYSEGQLERILGEDHYICRAVQTWHRDDLIRGKGKAFHQSQVQFE
jgi:ectoine hydroxylase-related dioxygenase (phytanoyl-CoA dioxygenase family)